MQTVRHKVKIFEQHRISRKVPGAIPGTWQTLSETTPVDESVNGWLAATGNTLVSCSPPSVHFQWLDRELTTRLAAIGLTVTYTEPVRERSVTVAVDPDPARDATAATRAKCL
jgi:hypothetical protein